MAIDTEKNSNISHFNTCSHLTSRSNDKDNNTIEAFKIQLKPIKPLTPGSKSVISHDPLSSPMPNQKSRKMQHRSSRGGNAVNKSKLNKNNKQ